MDLNTGINIVLVLATIAVVLYARQTVREARNATAEEKKIVTELQKLVATAEQNAASSATTMEAARETAEISRAALDDARRYRQLEQLRAIYRLVQDIRLSVDNAKVMEATGVSRPTWRCPQQGELRHAIVGSVPELPKCRELAGASGTLQVGAAVEYADDELGNAFRSLGAEGG